MTVGDVHMEDDDYGFKEVACPDCLAITGEIDPDCDLCEGDGSVYEMIAPEGEIEAVVRNVVGQIKALQSPN